MCPKMDMSVHRDYDRVAVTPDVDAADNGMFPAMINGRIHVESTPGTSDYRGIDCSSIEVIPLGERHNVPLINFIAHGGSSHSTVSDQSWGMQSQRGFPAPFQGPSVNRCGSTCR